jgi:hypothetical protein
MYIRKTGVWVERVKGGMLESAGFRFHPFCHSKGFWGNLGCCIVIYVAYA